MEFLDWLAASPLGQWVQSDQFAYYGLLSGHAIGMGIVVGAAYTLSARVLGFTNLSFAVFQRLYHVAWAGFGLNFLTGAILFTSNPRHLIENTPFLLKLTFVVLGGLALWALGRALDDRPPEGRASGGARILAIATVVLWTAAIVSGRLIAYTISYV